MPQSACLLARDKINLVRATTLRSKSSTQIFKQYLREESSSLIFNFDTKNDMEDEYFQAHLLKIDRFQNFG